MASLKARLERLKSLGLDLEPASGLEKHRAEKRNRSGTASEGPPAPKEPSREPSSHPRGAEGTEASAERGFLPGWERLAPHVFMKITEASLSVSTRMLDSRNFAPVRSARKTAQDLAVQDVPLQDVPIEDISFFDLETTGLSGGSGTIAFLAGIGWLAGSDFITAQIFIDDFPGEEAALGHITALLDERPWICSYNGKAFDLPLLRTRCIMNGIRFSEKTGHIDALTASRRLWKRILGSCALSDLEMSILGHSREADVPGAEIPRLWLDYSRMMAASEVPSELMMKMELVCSHNRTDILSLARLVLHIQKLYEDPHRYLSLHSAGASLDTRRLARHLIALGRIEEGLALLEESAAEGDEEALLLLARQYQSCGDRLNQARVLSALGADSYRACVEKAKFAEHVEKDYEKALDLALRAARIAQTDSLSIAHRENCEKRIRRIRRKMGAAQDFKNT